MWVFHRHRRRFLGAQNAADLFVQSELNVYKLSPTSIYSHSNSLSILIEQHCRERERSERERLFCSFLPLAFVWRCTSGTAEDGRRFSALWVLRRISAYHTNFSTCKPTPPYFRCALVSLGTLRRRRIDQIEKVSLAKDSAICNSDAVLQNWKLISMPQ